MTTADHTVQQEELLRQKIIHTVRNASQLEENDSDSNNDVEKEALLLSTALGRDLTTLAFKQSVFSILATTNSQSATVDPTVPLFALVDLSLRFEAAGAVDDSLALFLIEDISESLTIRLNERLFAF
ncbi:hypothetical protein HK100_004791, partial [Physocladia obscura]